MLHAFLKMLYLNVCICDYLSKNYFSRCMQIMCRILVKIQNVSNIETNNLDICCLIHKILICRLCFWSRLALINVYVSHP